MREVRLASILGWFWLYTLAIVPIPGQSQRLSLPPECGPGSIGQDGDAKSSRALEKYDAAHSLALAAKFGPALASLREALDLDPKFTAAHLAAAEILAGSGPQNFPQAAVHLSAVRRLCPQHLESGLLLARVLADGGAKTEAIDRLRQLAREQPKQAAVQVVLGEQLYAIGKHTQALEEFDRALKGDPSNQPARYGKAMCLLATGDATAAVRELKDLVSLNPAHARAHFQLGKQARSDKDLAGAIASFQRATGYEPDFAEAWAQLGAAYREQGDDAKSEYHYRQALKLNPDLSTALYGLARILSARGETAAAEEYLERFQRGRGDPRRNSQATYLNSAGLEQMSQGKLEQALSSFEEALKLDSAFAIAAYNAGVALARLRRADEAIISFQRAIELQPMLANAHYALGVLLKSKNKGDTRADYELNLARRLQEAGIEGSDGGSTNE
jgi:tetratricopeptide (TPR) repeat protein